MAFALVAQPLYGFISSQSANAASAVAYRGIPVSQPATYPSIGLTATSTKEMGDRIVLGGTNRNLDTVTVSLTSWACESGAWQNNDCVSAEGATFSHPVTVNLYKTTSTNAVGDLIASKTQSINAKYRPSADNTNCTGANAGKWFNAANSTCYNGIAFDTTFDFTAQNKMLPNDVIATVAYNTSSQGNAPLGAIGPYDSLNVSLMTTPPSVGTDQDPATIYTDSSFPGRTPGLAVDSRYSGYSFGININTSELAAPTNLTPTNGSATVNPSFDNTWSAVPGAVKYEYRTTYNNGASFYDDTSDDGNYELGGATIVRHNSNAPESTYAWQVRGIDANGNPGAWSVESIVTVDKTAPIAVALQSPADTTSINTNDFYFTWSNASDAGSAVKYEFQSSGSSATINGSLVGAWNSIANGNPEQNDLTSPMIHSTGAPNGTYYWQVRSYDAAGNKSAWSEVWSVSIDTMAPAAPTLITPSPYYENGPSKTLSWNASSSSDVAYYEYAEYNNTAPDSDTTIPSWKKNVDGTSTTDTAWNSDVTIYWRVRAVDYTGNKSAWSETRMIVTDHTAPAAPGNPTTSPNPSNSDSATWNWTASTGDALSGLKGYEYSLVKGDSIPTSWNEVGTNSKTVNFSDGDGVYTFYVRAKDNAGNVSAYTSGQVLVDTQGPVVAITNVVRNSNGTYTISGTTDDTATVEVTLTSGTTSTSQSATPVDGAWSVTTTAILASGQYTVRVASVDAATNESDAEYPLATRTFTVAQIVNPVTTIDLGAVTPLEAVSTGTLATVAGSSTAQTLGATNNTDATPSDDTDGEVLGTQDNKSTNKVAAIAPSEEGWKIFGIAWYWWLLILAAIAGIWWAIAGYRRRNSEEV